jgi:hypothetical protein
MIHRRLVLVVFGLICGTAARSWADDKGAVCLRSAADLAVAEPTLSAEPGEYHVFVWDAPGRGWRLSRDGDALTFRPGSSNMDGPPAWRELGTIQIDAGTPTRLRFEHAADQAESPKDTPPAPVPPLLALARSGDADLAPLLDIVRGCVDSARPCDDLRRTQIRTNQEGADFRAPATAQAWRDRARAVREQMRVSLGLWPPPERSDLNPQIYGKVERDGYTIEKVVLETLPGFYLAGNLYRPSEAHGRAPAVLCPHGHWEDGRVNPEVQQRAIRYAKLGCVAFLYDMVGYNDSKDFGHKFLNPRLSRWGYSLATLQTWNSLRVVDWLTSLPDVDPGRIGCTGESGGGTQTFLLTALDERVKVAAPVVMVSEGFQGGCVCENAAGLRHGTDNVEFAALAAPRPLKLVGATGDWTANTTTKILPVLRDVYGLIDEPDRVEAVVFTFPHNYNQTSRNAVYPFMARWLLDLDDPEATREGPQEPEKPEVLWTFDGEHAAPSDRKAPEQLEAHLIAQLNEHILGMSPEHAEHWPASREYLRTAHQVRLGIENPPPESLKPVDVRRADRDRLFILHSVVGHEPTGAQIPTVRLTPPEFGGTLTVVAHPRGKAGLVGGDGDPTPLVRALIDRGQSVVGFDALFAGESIDPGNPATRRPDTAHYATYNKTLAADRAQDLATVLAWARSLPDVRRVNLVGLEEYGPLVLLALPKLEGVSRTHVDMSQFDYGDGSGDVPAMLDLPGVLQFGGLNAAAALAAPRPLWIVGRVIDEDPARSIERWAGEAYRASGAGHLLRIDRMPASADAIAPWLDRGEWPVREL